jgi:shikimate kinase
VSDEGAVVVLIGAPGAGKTRTGRRVASRLDLPFVDTDKRIVASHGPIAAIFEELGEPAFRKIERAVVASALRERAVVTLGGGAVLNAATQRDLAGHRVVQLTVDAAAVERRIGGSKRPLVKDGIDSWKRLVAARQPLYDRLADLTIDTSRRPLDGVADEIVRWLEPANQEAR